ncbi:hypothetical protein PDE_09376 [Penicillium oxalicum 114-2]|uniref:Uncharacterized protein n=1 Tax=Penicillium oxalicum (strain 114-2 / CGMCC 5302) TaxID=933388 RepID=S8BH18_PENO1|nr:hypothetical protein PDE_09376 [Penicillium oxalicum 114-2]
MVLAILDHGGDSSRVPCEESAPRRHLPFGNLGRSLCSLLVAFPVGTELLLGLGRKGKKLCRQAPRWVRGIRIGAENLNQAETGARTKPEHHGPA